MTSTFYTQLCINRFHLPREMVDIIKDYLFHSIKRIPNNDTRYALLQNIPMKEFDPTDGVTFVYMRINREKDYFMTYYNYAIQLQTLVYDEDNSIMAIDGYEVEIE